MPDLEEAFIAYMEDGIAQEAKGSIQAKIPARYLWPQRPLPAPAHEKAAVPLPLRRLLAYARNEAIQIMRDPIRLTFAFLGSALLMLVCGFGITTDVEHIRVAAFDRDQSQAAGRTLSSQIDTPIFQVATTNLLRRGCSDRMQADEVAAVVEIPPYFGRDLRRGNTPDVLVQIDGAKPFRAETIRRVHGGRTQQPACRSRQSPLSKADQVHRGVPGALHVQPHVREHLLDRAQRTGDTADPDPSDPNDGQHRAREGARLDHQFLRYARQGGWSICSASNCPISRSG